MSPNTCNAKDSPSEPQRITGPSKPTVLRLISGLGGKLGPNPSPVIHGGGTEHITLFRCVCFYICKTDIVIRISTHKAVRVEQIQSIFCVPSVVGT